MLESARRLMRVRGAVQRGSAGPAHSQSLSFRRVLLCAAAALCLTIGLLPVSSSVSGPVAADDGVTVFLRVEGPVDADTFRDTGAYETIWSGTVVVPPEVTVTASTGKQYRLYVEDGRYLGTRLSDNSTYDLGPGDDSLGATSILAALHQASVEGSFSYEISDAYFPGMGFYLRGVGGYRESGSVGWAYRVRNDSFAPAPADSFDRFLLGYDSMEPTSPHHEVIVYYGYGINCRPLRLSTDATIVACGEPVTVEVECFVDDGYSGTGTWEPMQGASVCVGGDCCVTGPDGSTEVQFEETGTHHLRASAACDDDYWYIPSDGLTAVDVEGPCQVISFTMIDRGEPGINFGPVVCGTVDAPELGQAVEHGAVTLVVGPETTVPCNVQVKADGGLTSAGDSVIPLEGMTWDTDAEGGSATVLTTDYATVAGANAGEETTVDVWHWLTIPADQPPAAYGSEFYYRVVSAAQ
ncbi:MAG: hypothetical protein JW846_05115 [Dehalococcoidia bacterium]|nr:hypothetical protein [Dehalococcoidia bacterium]